MSIRIKQETCIGCGQCIDVCPGSLIGRDADGKAQMQYPKDCWGCTSCIKECPVNAVKFFLGADIGGMGSLVHTEKKGDILNWIIERPDGTKTEIKINQKESNKY